jgi:sulfur relay (sulfurtransferase) DsrC/TusE family protein
MTLTLNARTRDESRLGQGQDNPSYLYQLFPRGYGQQACKFAGMRKSRKLMLDV